MLLLITAVLLFACAPEHHPLAPLDPAGKINPQTAVSPSERLFVVWDCGADQWATAQDSTWTIFYPQSRFLIRSKGIRITEYLDDNRKAVYDAFSETNLINRARAGLITHENYCALWSDIIDRDSVSVRLYQGEVFWKWRTLPLHAQYVQRIGDEETQVAQTRDSLVVHPSFDTLPFNFNQDALDTLASVPQDDRPYLDNLICQGADCPPSILSQYIPPPVVDATSVVSNDPVVSSGIGGIASSGTGGGSGTPQGDSTSTGSSGETETGESSGGDDGNDGASGDTDGRIITGRCRN